jgi:ubiquinone/menaquinone biosynthesis C-methylase UbiE
MPGDNLKLADQFAPEYDYTINDDNWFGPQVLFVELNPFLHPKSKIIDFGIGTGAGSVLFKNEGHQITGVDGSEEMLKICRRKNIAEKLILHDLEKMPIPVKGNSFHAVISNGVFHLIHPIIPVIEEAKRLLIPNGYLVFTFEKNTVLEDSTEIKPGIWEKKTKTGVLTYKHSTDFIFEILKENGFKIIFQTEFLAFFNHELQTEFRFIAVVAKLNQPD